MKLLAFLLLSNNVFGQANRKLQQQCALEPWGRYSASGGLYRNNNATFLYSFGGDTSSRADTAGGGVVGTSFRYNLQTACWERLADNVVPIGYRGTATLLKNIDDGEEDAFYVFGGGDRQYAAVDHFYRYGVETDQWEQVNITTTAARPSARYKHAAVRIDPSTLVIHGGRVDRNVHSDAWMFSATQMQWTRLGDTGVALYRQGMAYDPTRQTIWMFGGLDGDLTRHARMYRWEIGDLTTNAGAAMNTTLPRMEQVDYGGIDPGRRASHVLEYVPELDALLMYGGTCGDNSETYLYNISTKSWCTIATAGHPPSLRDAMLWAVDYPNFFIYQGDVICVRVGHVYGIADVHSLQLDPDQPAAWRQVYEPRNQRAPQLTETCDGTNAGSCRVPSTFQGAKISTTGSCGDMDESDTTATPISMDTTAPSTPPLQTEQPSLFSVNKPTSKAHQTFCGSFVAFVWSFELLWKLK